MDRESHSSEDAVDTTGELYKKFVQEEAINSVLLSGPYVHTELTLGKDVKKFLLKTKTGSDSYGIPMTASPATKVSGSPHHPPAPNIYNPAPASAKVFGAQINPVIIQEYYLQQFDAGPTVSSGDGKQHVRYQTGVFSLTSGCIASQGISSRFPSSRISHGHSTDTPLTTRDTSVHTGPCECGRLRAELHDTQVALQNVRANPLGLVFAALKRHKAQEADRQANRARDFEAGLNELSTSELGYPDGSEQMSKSSTLESSLADSFTSDGDDSRDDISETSTSTLSEKCANPACRDGKDKYSILIRSLNNLRTQVDGQNETIACLRDENDRLRELPMYVRSRIRSFSCMERAHEDTGYFQERFVEDSFGDEDSECGGVKLDHNATGEYEEATMTTTTTTPDVGHDEDADSDILSIISCTSSEKARHRALWKSFYAWKDSLDQETATAVRGLSFNQQLRQAKAAGYETFEARDTDSEYDTDPEDLADTFDDSIIVDGETQENRGDRVYFVAVQGILRDVKSSNTNAPIETVGVEPSSINECFSKEYVAYNHGESEISLILDEKSQFNTANGYLCPRPQRILLAGTTSEVFFDYRTDETGIRLRAAKLAEIGASLARTTFLRSVAGLGLEENDELVPKAAEYRYHKKYSAEFEYDGPAPAPVQFTGDGPATLRDLVDLSEEDVPHHNYFPDTWGNPTQYNRQNTPPCDDALATLGDLVRLTEPEELTYNDRPAHTPVFNPFQYWVPPLVHTERNPTAEELETADNPVPSDSSSEQSFVERRIAIIEAQHEAFNAGCDAALARLDAEMAKYRPSKGGTRQTPMAGPEVVWGLPSEDTQGPRYV
jgi:hypothetical protein